MSNVLSFPANPSEPRSRTLHTARRLEVLALLVISPLVALHYQPHGVLLCLLLLTVAVILVPRDRALGASTREQRRRQTLDGLLTEALTLRSDYMHVRNQPLSQARSDAQWQARREILTWLDSSARRLRGYPEFAGILEYHRRRGGLLEELDGSIRGLAELKRLSNLSQRLNLPI